MESPPETYSNTHANALVIGNKGLLIRGRSGSGKSSLSLSLLATAHASGNFARLVGDDQILLAAANGRLVARCPGTITGSIEVRGYGLTKIASLPSCIIHLVVDIVHADNVERMTVDRFVDITSVRLPMVQVPENCNNRAHSIIAAALSDGI